jgi:nucleoside-diphosphate-sugar epimerase
MIEKVMHILVTGNMGYVGSVLTSEIRKKLDAEIIGLDSAFFAENLLDKKYLPERDIGRQIFKDARDVTERDFKGIDAVICLAALSNDPMGDRYGMQTIEINYGAVAKTALLAKHAGVKAFIFASSCSVYGFSESGECDESSPVNPLTEYARSKVLSERFLEGIACESFHVTCFRFATACGASPRLRLDLVLNDFVASALTKKKIEILSDGTPWRPLIDVKDMSSAIIWGISHNAGVPYMLLNAGSDDWNFQIRDLAQKVRDVMPETEIYISPDGQPDKRSYRVKFDKFRSLTDGAAKIGDIRDTVREIRDILTDNAFCDADFRNSEYMRLNVLKRLKKSGKIGVDLRWVAEK